MSSQWTWGSSEHQRLSQVFINTSRDNKIAADAAKAAHARKGKGLLQVLTGQKLATGVKKDQPEVVSDPIVVDLTGNLVNRKGRRYDPNQSFDPPCEATAEQLSTRFLRPVVRPSLRLSQVQAAGYLPTAMDIDAMDIVEEPGNAFVIAGFAHPMTQPMASGSFHSMYDHDVEMTDVSEPTIFRGNVAFGEPIDICEPTIFRGNFAPGEPMDICEPTQYSGSFAPDVQMRDVDMEDCDGPKKRRCRLKMSDEPMMDDCEPMMDDCEPMVDDFEPMMDDCEPMQRPSSFAFDTEMPDYCEPTNVFGSLRPKLATAQAVARNVAIAQAVAPKVAKYQAVMPKIPLALQNNEYVEETGPLPIPGPEPLGIVDLRWKMSNMRLLSSGSVADTKARATSTVATKSHYDLCRAPKIPAAIKTSRTSFATTKASGSSIAATKASGSSVATTKAPGTSVAATKGTSFEATKAFATSFAATKAFATSFAATNAFATSVATTKASGTSFAATKAPGTSVAATKGTPVAATKAFATSFEATKALATSVATTKASGTPIAATKGTPVAATKAAATSVAATKASATSVAATKPSPTSVAATKPSASSVTAGKTSGTSVAASKPSATAADPSKASATSVKATKVSGSSVTATKAQASANKKSLTDSRWSVGPAKEKQTLVMDYFHVITPGSPAPSPVHAGDQKTMATKVKSSPAPCLWTSPQKAAGKVDSSPVPSLWTQPALSLDQSRDVKRARPRGKDGALIVAVPREVAKASTPIVDKKSVVPAPPVVSAPVKTDSALVKTDSAPVKTDSVDPVAIAETSTGSVAKKAKKSVGFTADEIRVFDSSKPPCTVGAASEKIAEAPSQPQEMEQSAVYESQILPVVPLYPTPTAAEKGKGVATAAPVQAAPTPVVPLTIESDTAEEMLRAGEDDEYDPFADSSSEDDPFEDDPSPVGKGKGKAEITFGDDDKPAPVDVTPSPVVPGLTTPKTAEVESKAKKSEEPAPVKVTPSPVLPVLTTPKTAEVVSKAKESEDPAPVMVTPSPVLPVVSTPETAEVVSEAKKSEEPAPVMVTPSPVVAVTSTPTAGQSGKGRWKPGPVNLARTPVVPGATKPRTAEKGKARVGRAPYPKGGLPNRRENLFKKNDAISTDEEAEESAPVKVTPSPVVAVTRTPTAGQSGKGRWKPGPVNLARTPFVPGATKPSAAEKDKAREGRAPYPKGGLPNRREHFYKKSFTAEEDEEDMASPDFVAWICSKQMERGSMRLRGRRFAPWVLAIERAKEAKKQVVPMIPTKRGRVTRGGRRVVPLLRALEWVEQLEERDPVMAVPARVAGFRSIRKKWSRVARGDFYVQPLFLAVERAKQMEGRAELEAAPSPASPPVVSAPNQPASLEATSKAEEGEKRAAVEVAPTPSPSTSPVVSVPTEPKTAEAVATVKKTEEAAPVKAASPPLVTSPEVTPSPVAPAPEVATSPLVTVPEVTPVPVATAPEVAPSPVEPAPEVATSPLVTVPEVATTPVVTLPEVTTAPVVTVPEVATPLVTVPEVTPIPVATAPEVASSPVVTVPELAPFEHTDEPAMPAIEETATVGDSEETEEAEVVVTPPQHTVQSPEPADDTTDGPSIVSQEPAASSSDSEARLRLEFEGLRLMAEARLRFEAETEAEAEAAISTESTKAEEAAVPVEPVPDTVQTTEAAPEETAPVDDAALLEGAAVDLPSVPDNTDRANQETAPKPQTAIPEQAGAVVEPAPQAEEEVASAPQRRRRRARRGSVSPPTEPSATTSTPEEVAPAIKPTRKRETFAEREARRGRELVLLFAKLDADELPGCARLRLKPQDVPLPPDEEPPQPWEVPLPGDKVPSRPEAVPLPSDPVGFSYDEVLEPWTSPPGNPRLVLTLRTRCGKVDIEATRRQFGFAALAFLVIGVVEIGIHF